MLLSRLCWYMACLMHSEPSVVSLTIERSTNKKGLRQLSQPLFLNQRISPITHIAISRLRPVRCCCRQEPKNYQGSAVSACSNCPEQACLSYPARG